MADPEPGPQPVSRLSRTPSWVMLGFILGAAFVALLPSRRLEPAAPAAETDSTSVPSGPSSEPMAPREPGPLLTIEAVFAAWQRLAAWSDDTTEVALWNARDRGFTDFYEVRRHGDALYFRSLPRLTRRIIERGQPPEAPLQFTETEEQYQQWRESSRQERSQGVPARPPAASAPAPAPVRVEVSPGEPLPPRIEVPPPGRTVVK